MQYMILIHADEQAFLAQPAAELTASMAAYGAYTQALIAAGVMAAASQLDRAATAKIVTVKGADARVVDGPYADTREELGGFYLINVESEAEAIDWAKKCPGAAHGVVELRPCLNAG